MYYYFKITRKIAPELGPVGLTDLKRELGTTDQWVRLLEDKVIMGHSIVEPSRFARPGTQLHRALSYLEENFVIEVGLASWVC